ncbi:MAG: MBL fold metallo-hydrolase [Candidatus Bathyarchaeota archaeon]|nr:MBL fold metallo-hydrolase [Candidatus Bathyarchaeota archaeon]
MQQLKGIRTIDHSEARDHSLETWVLDCPEGAVLVDGGMTPQAVENIAAELKSMKKTWKDVKLILVTHKHGDHVKNLPKLKELTGAPVKAHKLEAPLIEKAVGVKVEGLEDGQVIPNCGGIEVIWVPGHSEGNACYYLREQKAIIAGDTIFSDPDGNLIAPPEKWCLDAKQAAKGIERLLGYDFDYLLYTHGKDVMGGAKAKVKELVDSTRGRA